MRRTIITLLLAAVCAASGAQTATLLLRADSLARAGLHAEALPIYAQVTAMLDSMGTKPLRSVRLRALVGMASCHQATGDYRDALADYTAMRDAKLLDVRGLLNMSNVCLALGLYTDVVDMLEPIDAGRWQHVRLLNLASAYAYLKRTDDALRLISQTTTDGLPADVKATTEANRGFILMSTGRSQEAARALAEAAHMTADGRTRCIITANLALAESACGRHADALAHIDSCLAWQAENIGKSHPDYAISVRKRAEILLAAGMRADAAASFKEYLELTRVEVIRSFAMLTAKQRQDFWFSRQPLVAECYETGTEDPGMAYDAALLSKSILMQADADIRQAARRDTATTRLYNGMERLRRKAASGTTTPHEADSLNAEADRLERQLMAALEEYGEMMAGTNATWRDVAARLKRGEAAVEFVRYGRAADKRYAAIVLKAGAKPVFTPLWSEDSLKACKLENGMTLGQAIASTRPQDKNAIYADSTLTDKLLSQIYKLTARCSRIYFAPDGMLHLLAMENMDGAPGGGDRMCRLTSTRELLRTDNRSGQGALLVGGLSYDDCDATPYPTNASPDRTAATTLSRLQLPPAAQGGYRYLPSTATEVDTIAAIIRKTWKNTRTERLKGTDGTETAFKRMIDGKRLVHLASHGFCFAANGETEPLAYCRDSLREDETMRRSGVILAGANRMVRPQFGGCDDGVMLSSEFATARLSQAEMVVMSACQTGLGPVTPEGVFGLQRGLKKAGAGAMVVSLWNVDDRASLLFMASLYRHMADGLSTAQAMAKARRDVRQHTVSVTVETDEDDTSKPQVRRLGRWVWPKKTAVKTLRPYADARYWAAFIMIDGK